MVPIKGYEGFYTINEEGQIWSCKKNIYRKLSKNRRGYLKLELVKDRVHKTHELHRLLALQFIPNPTGRPLTDHINRIRLDNRLENLRWVTSCENNWNRRMSIYNTSGHTGVSWCESRKKWVGRLRANKKIYVKRFVLLEDAIAYRVEMEELHQKIGATVK